MVNLLKVFMIFFSLNTFLGLLVFGHFANQPTVHSGGVTVAVGIRDR